MNTNDKTQEIRLKHWAELIHACKSSGLTDKEWLIQNGIPRNQFYYWQRRLRAKAILAMKQEENTDSTHTLVEITQPTVPVPTPTDSLSGTGSLLYIRIADAVIEVNNNTTPEIFRMVIQELRHAQ